MCERVRAKVCLNSRKKYVRRNLPSIDQSERGDICAESGLINPGVFFVDCLLELRVVRGEKDICRSARMASTTHQRHKHRVDHELEKFRLELNWTKILDKLKSNSKDSGRLSSLL